MAVSKVELANGEVLVDLTDDNVTADKMLLGTTAHDKSGETITGTVEVFDGSYECSGESTGGGESGGDVAPTPVIQLLEVTENGVYAPPTGVDGYAPVKVSVPIPDGYIKPSGILDISANGLVDVTEYAAVMVEVPSSGGSGDASIETCTVTLQNYFATGSFSNDDFYRMFYYVDSTLNTVSVLLPIQESIDWRVEPTIHTFIVAKNTMVFAPHGLAVHVPYEAFEGITDVGGSTNTGIVRGDCTLSIG